MSTQLIYALILAVHLVTPTTADFSVEVLEAGAMIDIVEVQRRSGIYRYYSSETDQVLFQTERSRLNGQFFLVFDAEDREPQLVDLSEAFAELAELPVARDRIDVLEWRLRRGRDVLYLEMPDITTVLVIHSAGPPYRWISEPPPEPWAR